MPSGAAVNNTLVDIFLVVEVFCAPILIYLVLFESKQMTRYRYYILNNVIWNVLADLCMWFAQVRFHFPVECVSIESVIPVGNLGATWVVFVLLLCVANMEFAVMWSLLYRYAYALSGRLQDVFENPKKMVVLLLLPEIIVGLPFVVITFFLRMTSEYFERIAAVDSPFGIYCFAGGWFFRFCSYGLAFAMFVLFVVSCSMYIQIFYTVVLNNKTTWFNQRTQRVQAMLIKAMGIQLFLGYIFLLFPVLMLWFSVAAEWESSANIAATAATLAAMHGPIDCMGMMICITPYRRTILGWMGVKRNGTRARVSVITSTGTRASVSMCTDITRSVVVPTSS